MKKILFSFGNWRFYKTLEVLEHTSKQKGNIDIFIPYKETDIPTDFYIKNIKTFQDGRGFGYWIWKSFFIQNLLATASDNDIFLYIDSGNEVIEDLTPLYKLCQEDSKGIILFDNADGEPTGSNWKNNLWTKSDCFNLMGLNTKEYVYGNQVNASYIVFRKTNFSTNFFNCFADACSHYNIISDAPNITDNFNKDFRDHRHDQSILSLLSIRYKITIKRDPSQWGNSRIKNTDEYQQLFFHHRRKYYI